MNNSAFKANVHLNIISHSSLFFSLSVDRKKRSFQTTWTAAEVHFVKMQTLMDFHFLSSQKVQNDILWIFLWKGPGTSKNIYSWTLPDAPQKSIRQSASLSLSLCGDEAESLYVLFSVWYIHLFPQKAENAWKLRTGGRKKAFPGHFAHSLSSIYHTVSYAYN